MEGEKQACEGAVFARIELHCGSHDSCPVSFRPSHLVHQCLQAPLLSAQAGLLGRHSRGNLSGRDEVQAGAEGTHRQTSQLWFLVQGAF